MYTYIGYTYTGMIYLVYYTDRDPYNYGIYRSLIEQKTTGLYVYAEDIKKFNCLID